MLGRDVTRRHAVDLLVLMEFSCLTTVAEVRYYGYYHIYVAEDAIVAWDAVPGKRYCLEYKTRLEDDKWTTLGIEVQADTEIANLKTPLPDNPHSGFYRVRVSP